MNAEILCVGTEILLGDITNTNATYISQKLAEKGINVFHHTVVGDNPARLERAVSDAVRRSDLVITTGGLGPTYDDLTKEIVSAHFCRQLRLHGPSLQMIRKYFGNDPVRMTANNLKQAVLPEGCLEMPNHNGTAPGVIIEATAGEIPERVELGDVEAAIRAAVEEGPSEKDGIRPVPDALRERLAAAAGSEEQMPGGQVRTSAVPEKIVILLPGPPRELRAMWEEYVDPYLESLSEDTIVSHSIRLFGIGESAMEAMLHEYLLGQVNPTAAPYAKDGECMLRVTAKASTKEAAEAMMQPMIKELCEKLDRFVYGVDVPDLQTVLVHTLKERGLTVSAAESFTGGLIAKRITDVSGASSVISYSAVTYANSAKHKYLGVREETLDAYGAVSEQTAREMAEGIRRVSGADIGIAATGVAGPDPSEGKAVGTCFVAVSYRDTAMPQDSCAGTADAAGTAMEDIGVSQIWPRTDPPYLYRENGCITIVQQLHLGRGRVDDRELIRFIGASHALNMARKAALRIAPKG